MQYGGKYSVVQMLYKFNKKSPWRYLQGLFKVTPTGLKPVTF